MDPAIGGEDIVSEQIERFALNAGDQPAGFLDQQHAGGLVPGIEFQFPKAIETPGCNGTLPFPADTKKRVIRIYCIYCGICNRESTYTHLEIAGKPTHQVFAF